MSYGGYRRSDHDLAYGDEGPKPQRWDRDRFERVRARSRGPGLREKSRFDEEDRFGSRGERRDFEFDERIDRRGPRGRFEERDRYQEEDRFKSRKSSFRNSRPPEFFEEDRYRGGRELAPYKDRWDKDNELPSRPAPMRRNSSWDSFDRRPGPRQDERPEMKLSVRVGQGHNQGQEHEEEIRYRDDDRRYRDDDRFHRDESRYREEPRYFREPEPYDRYHDRGPGYRDRQPYEDYRDARIIKETEREYVRRAPSRSRERSERRESDSFEEISRSEASPPRKHKKEKRGKTRMPKRLVQKRVILEIGYPFEETVSEQACARSFTLTLHAGGFLLRIASLE